MFFGQRLYWLLLKVVKQVAAGHELRNDVMVLSVFIGVDQLDDVADLCFGALSHNGDFAYSVLVLLQSFRHLAFGADFDGKLRT